MSTLPDTGHLREPEKAGGFVMVLGPADGPHGALAEVLREAGFEVFVTADPVEAARVGQERHADLAIVDRALAGRLEEIGQLASAAVLLGESDAVEADVFIDALAQPVPSERLLAAARFASELGRLTRKIERLERKLAGLRSQPGLVGCSPPIRRLSTALSRVAESDATVLIEGKPGSGKTLAAQIIHAGSRRSDRQRISVPSESVDEPGMTELLERADGTTLVLEDVEQLPAAAQAVLVRFLKERPGPDRKPDIRLLATTSARLPEQVARGAFREDLYYRLSSFPIVVPALHERREDVAVLAMHFLHQACEESDSPVYGFTPTAMILLESHPWPGNVAQLETAVIRAQCLAEGGPIDRGHLLGPATGLDQEHEIELEPKRPWDADDEDPTEADILPMEEEEKRLLTRALKATGGNVRRAAQLLGIGRATLYRKIQIYRLKLN